jgi:hypothetical protein
MVSARLHNIAIIFCISIVCVICVCTAKYIDGGSVLNTAIIHMVILLLVFAGAHQTPMEAVVIVGGGSEDIVVARVSRVSFAHVAGWWQWG